MRVKLKNVGDAARVIYTVSRNPVSIAIGQERVVDLLDVTIAKLRGAQEKGDTLHVSPASQRVRVLKPGDEPPVTKGAIKVPLEKAETITATQALATAENLDYHGLLGVVNRIVPKNDLPPRPTKMQMLDVLRAAASKEK
jgi:hypothetical protein